jgi:hypothetical protein
MKRISAHSPLDRCDVANRTHRHGTQYGILPNPTLHVAYGHVFFASVRAAGTGVGNLLVGSYAKPRPYV